MGLIHLHEPLKSSELSPAGDRRMWQKEETEGSEAREAFLLPVFGLKYVENHA